MFPLHFNLHCQISVWYLKCMIFLICTQWGYLDSPVSMCVCQRFITCRTWYLKIVLSTLKYIQVFYWLNKNVHKVVKVKSIQMVSYCKKKLGWCVYVPKSICDITSRCHVNFVITHVQSFQVLQYSSWLHVRV